MRVADRPLATGYLVGQAHRPGWSRTVLVILGGASLAVVIGLWAGNHGLSDLAPSGSGTTSLGRLTGLVAADLLLVQVILMARVPLIRAVLEPGSAHPRAPAGWTLVVQPHAERTSSLSRSGTPPRLRPASSPRPGTWS
jgi:hypothetical protein